MNCPERTPHPRANHLEEGGSEYGGSGWPEAPSHVVPRLFPPLGGGGGQVLVPLFRSSVVFATQKRTLFCRVPATTQGYLICTVHLQEPLTSSVKLCAYQSARIGKEQHKTVRWKGPGKLYTRQFFFQVQNMIHQNSIS